MALSSRARGAFSISVIIAPRLQTRTSPVDSDNEMAMLFVLAVVAAAAACRAPSPCGNRSPARAGRSVAQAETITPLPLMMNAPSSLAISLTVSRMVSSRMLRSFSV